MIYLILLYFDNEIYYLLRSIPTENENLDGWAWPGLTPHENVQPVVPAAARPGTGAAISTG